MYIEHHYKGLNTFSTTNILLNYLVLIFGISTIYKEYTKGDPKVLRRVVLKKYCALHLATDTITT